MPPRQLTPAEQADLANLALNLSHNPKTRPAIAKAIKDAGLSAYLQSFSDVTADEPKELIEATFAERDRKDEAKRNQQRIEGQRADLLATGRFTDESIKGLETYMQAKGLIDYGDAAILYAHDNPPAAPRPTIATRGAWEMPKGDWVNDRINTSRREAYAAIDALKQRSA